MIERHLVAIEERLVGRHRLDDLDDQPLIVGLELADQLGERRDAGLARERGQAALHQILLVGRENEAGAIFQELAEVVVIGRCHDFSPPNSRTIFGPIWSSGSTAEQTPACAAAPGMPQTTLVASSCAITLP